MAPAAPLKPTAYFWRLIRYRPGYYATDLSVITIHMVLTAGAGLILRGYFNGLTGEPGFQLTYQMAVLLQLGFALALSVTQAIPIVVWFRFQHHAMALLVVNMVQRLLDRPGGDFLPRAADGSPMSAGTAISTLREDTENLLEAMVLIDDFTGALVMSVISFGIMFSISVPITLGTFLPLALVIVAAQLLGTWVKRYRRASRAATSQVTGLIADMFNATQTLKASGAEERVIAHFRRMNDTRRHAMVRDRFFTRLVDTLSNSTIDVGMGLVLLLAAQAMSRGTFTIGDFVLFAAYIWPATQLMRLASRVITSYQQALVATSRMEQVMQGAPPGAVAAHRPIYARRPLPPLPFTPPAAVEPLERLDIRGLTYHYPGSAAGIDRIDLTVRRGTFVVITGRIGSGKTTLLKVLLGLLPAESGEMLWNDRPVIDPRTFMTPPRVAFTPQVPRLFSESLRDNLLLGVPADEVPLQQAIWQAVLEGDVANMEAGLETLVGPRGVRLSGGQLQRAAAARMFVRTPQLHVFDDLSSALDVETEQTLWQRLFDAPAAAGPPTCLVVSHRRAALQQADEIVVMADGRVSDRGTLAALLERSAEMRALWAKG